MCLDQAGGEEEICGQAMLCFNEDRTGFQGSIRADDSTMYVITGAKCKRRRLNNEGLGHSYQIENEDLVGMPIYFDIRVVDCDIGEEYNLKRVRGSIGEYCTFSCNCLSFTMENIYRGQKADMMVQQLLGQSLEGFHKSVQTGYISLRCSATRINTPWVL